MVIAFPIWYDVSQTRSRITASNPPLCRGVDSLTLAAEGARCPMWDEDWQSLRFMAAERRIRIAMSVHALRRVPEPPRIEHLIGVADPSPGPSGDVDDLVHRLRSGRLEPLPHARAELASIAAAISRAAPASEAHVLIGPHATRHALADIIRHHKVDCLHFAAHGLADVDQPLRSRIFLAPDETGSRADLTVEWLYANPIDAAVVVLSCCETALGLAVSQEAVIGLPRAFLASGAETVVATLWRVPDDPRLMERFYGCLLAGLDVARSLTEAQRSLIADSAHPVYWAGYQCYS